MPKSNSYSHYILVYSLLINKESILCNAVCIMHLCEGKILSFFSFFFFFFFFLFIFVVEDNIYIYIYIKSQS